VLPQFFGVFLLFLGFLLVFGVGIIQDFVVFGVTLGFVFGVGIIQFSGVWVCYNRLVLVGGSYLAGFSGNFGFLCNFGDFALFCVVLSGLAYFRGILLVFGCFLGFCSVWGWYNTGIWRFGGFWS